MQRGGCDVRKSLSLNAGAEEKALTSVVKAKTITQKRMVDRCRIILLTEDGFSLDDIYSHFEYQQSNSKSMEAKFFREAAGRIKRWKTIQGVPVISEAMNDWRL